MPPVAFCYAARMAQAAGAQQLGGAQTRPSQPGAEAAAQDTVVSAAAVLAMLRQLPPHDRLKVIAEALPEVVRQLPDPPRPRATLLGFLAHLGPAPSAEDIDEARREAWANFPRDDI